MYKIDRDKSDRTYDQGDGISAFVTKPVLKFGQEGCPDERADCLYAEDNAYPVTGYLECFFRRIGLDLIPAKAVSRYGTVRIGPHIHECCPAEELHEAYRPERRGSFFEKGNKSFLRLIVFFLTGNTVELGVLLRIELFDGSEGVERAEDENRCAGIEGPFHRIRNNTLGSGIGNSDPGKEDREEVTYDRTGVTESRLDGVCRTLLLLVDHIADHHFEGLHGDIDGGIQEHEAEQAEPHRRIEAEEEGLREGEVTCIRQKEHHRDRDERAHEQIGFTTPETRPGLVTVLTDQRLHDHTHQRREYPEETQRVGVSTQSGKNT